MNKIKNVIRLLISLNVAFLNGIILIFFEDQEILELGMQYAPSISKEDEDKMAFVEKMNRINEDPRPWDDGEPPIYD